MNCLGGSVRTPSINQTVRAMHENRRWTLAIKARDGQCLQCGTVDNLESHHKTELADLIAKFDVKTRDDARKCGALWSLDNGVTLCVVCHYAEHGRSGDPQFPRVTHIRACEECRRSFAIRPSLIKQERGRFCSKPCFESWRSVNATGAANANWKGGLIKRHCLNCDAAFMAKPCIVKRGGARFCNRSCQRSFYNAA